MADEFDKGMEPEKEDDVYNKESRDQQEEDAEITPEEEGFMKGYEGESVNCATCGKVIVDKENVVQKEIEGEEKIFDSQHCADNYNK